MILFVLLFQSLSLFRCNVVPSLNQIEFNPYIVDNDILDVCKCNKIVVQAYSPLGTGAGVTVREISEAIDRGNFSIISLI